MRISQDEFKHRLSRVSSVLSAAGYDALIAFGSRVESGPVRYLTGYEPWLTPEEWALALFTPGSEITLLSNSPWDFHDFNKGSSTWVTDVLVTSNWMEAITARIPSSVRRVGIAGWRSFPAPLYSGLTAHFPNTVFDDVAGLIREQRAIKSDAEVEILREVGRIADAGGRAFFDTIVPGVTEREVAAKVESTMWVQGAEGFGYPANIGSGSRTIASCFLPGARKILPGDIVQLDCAPMLEGYRADFSRAVVAGESGDALRLVETVAEIYETLAGILRAGIECSAVAQTGLETLERRGYGRENLYASANYPGLIFMGHGIGLENPDPPGMLSTANHTILEENMVINLEPILLDPNVGGARIEGAFVIRAQGAEPLSLCPIRG